MRAFIHSVTLLIQVCILIMLARKVWALEDSVIQLQDVILKLLGADDETRG